MSNEVDNSMKNVMTSNNLRRIRKLKSTFPPYHFCNRLEKLDRFKQLGFFSIDRVCIVTKDKVKYEDFLGDYKGAIPNEKGNGKTHLYSLKGYEYQFFQGKGRVRRLMFNPRHFKSYDLFLEFVNEVTSGREYHITQIDFSFFLSKRYFSVDFIYWILWVKGGEVTRPLHYKHALHATINRAKSQSFVIGQTPRRVSVYDCDAHNIDKDRDLKKMVHDSINIEISIRTQKAIEKLNIKTVDDLRNQFSVEQVMHGISFIEPSNTHLTSMRLTDLLPVWEVEGATTFMRKAYELSKGKKYDLILQPDIKLLNSTLKQALVSLANRDFENFIKGKQEPWRHGIQSCLYSMEPLYIT